MENPILRASFLASAVAISPQINAQTIPDRIELLEATFACSQQVNAILDPCDDGVIVFRTPDGTDLVYPASSTPRLVDSGATPDIYGVIPGLQSFTAHTQDGNYSLSSLGYRPDGTFSFRPNNNFSVPYQGVASSNFAQFGIAAISGIPAKQTFFAELDTVTPVPELSTNESLTLGLAGLALFLNRKKIATALGNKNQNPLPA